MIAKTMIRKKTRESSLMDLSKQLYKFSQLLSLQKEEEAAVALKNIAKNIHTPGEDLTREMDLLEELFTGEQELAAYTIKRKTLSAEWSEAEELYMASTAVWNLVQRLKTAKK